MQLTEAVRRQSVAAVRSVDVLPTNSNNVSVGDAEIKKQRSMWGLTRTLIQNAVTGMTGGFTVPLYLVGVGYRAAASRSRSRPPGKVEGVSGTRLLMKLGFSHPVIVPVPDNVKAEVPYATKIVLSCTDKH